MIEALKDTVVRTDGMPNSVTEFAYSQDPDQNLGEQYRLLSSNEDGDMILYDTVSGNNIRYNPNSSVWSVVTQETTVQSHESFLPPELAEAINAAGSFENAIRIAVHDYNHTNPRMLVAAIAAIAQRYPSEINREILDEVTTEAINTGARLALGDRAPQGTREDGIDSMIDALPLLSSAKITAIMPQVQDTVDRVLEEVNNTGRNQVATINPIRVEAASEILERLTESGVDVQHVDVATVLEQETTKVELLSRRVELIQELAALDQHVEAIDQIIAAEIGPAPRRGIFRAVHHLLRTMK